MPIYEYECRKCKAHTEALQKITDKPLTKCRKCGGRLEKQWSQAGIQFKGSGWYVTDYAAKKADTSEEKKSLAAETAAPATAPANDSSAPKTKDTKAKETTATKKSSSTKASSNTSGD